jgi:hypothetical protein
MTVQFRRRLACVALLSALVTSTGSAAEPVVAPGPVTVVEVPVVTAPAPSPPPASRMPPPPPPAAAGGWPPGPNSLPPMNFYASVASDELLKRVKYSEAFARLEKDMYGSPIQLSVTHSLQPTAGGQAAGLLSAIWAGSTLGLLPVVTNNNLVLTYEVRVNGKEIVRYDFARSFTRAVNIWSEKNDPTYGLGEEGLEWVRATADEFVAKAAADPALKALADEYRFYFGPGKT